MAFGFELTKRLISAFLLSISILYLYAQMVRSEVFCDNVAPPNVTFDGLEMTRISTAEYLSIDIHVNGSSFSHHRLYYAIVYIPTIDYVGVVKNFGSSVYRYLFS